MTPVLKSSLFEDDFADCALRISESRPSAALRFVDAVEAAIELLSSHPEMGPLWRYGRRHHPTRYLLVPGFHDYLMFYRYESGEIHLGRLMHGAQDLRDVLGD